MTKSETITGIAIIVTSLAILVIGCYIIYLIIVERPILNDPQPKSPNPFAPHAIQILGLTLLLPTIMIVSLNNHLEGEAITALLGSIVGYLFGSTKSGGGPTSG